MVERLTQLASAWTASAAMPTENAAARMKYGKPWSEKARIPVSCSYGASDDLSTCVGSETIEKRRCSRLLITTVWTKSYTAPA